MMKKMSKRIVLDAGHGMYTTGKRCMKEIDPNETREWWLNQRIASKVEERLKSYDVEVLRVDDSTGKTDVPLGTRCKKANDYKADIYCSFHHDAGANGSSAGGITVFTYDNSAEAVKLRNTLYECLRVAGGLAGRATPKRANPGLYVLNSTRMIAVLVEHGFMDSTNDTPVILTNEYAEKMANGWIEFFEKYLGLKKKAADQPAEAPAHAPAASPSIPAGSGYKVRVTAWGLNIRKGPGISYPVVGCIRDKGVYTIVEEQMNGSTKWGRLKSGAGWISLGYTKKV